MAWEKVRILLVESFKCRGLIEYIAYVYVPETSELCSQSNYMCNSDGFGTSVDRGSFSFVTAQ